MASLPETISDWCDRNEVTYEDLVPYVILANGKTAPGQAE